MDAVHACLLQVVAGSGKVDRPNHSNQLAALLRCYLNGFATVLLIVGSHKNGSAHQVMDVNVGSQLVSVHCSGYLFEGFFVIDDY